MTNSTVEKAFLLLKLDNPFIDFKGLLTMCNPFENLLVDNALSRKRFSQIQGRLFFVDFNNLLGKFSYLSLVVRDLLVESLLFVETFLLLGLKIIEFSLTNFTEIPLSSHLVDLRLNLKVIMPTKSEVFDQLCEESFKFNQVLVH